MSPEELPGDDEEEEENSAAPFRRKARTSKNLHGTLPLGKVSMTRIKY